MVAPLQKYPNPKVYSSKTSCSYECTFPGYAGSSFYPTFHRDVVDIPADPDHIMLSGLQYHVNTLNAHEKNLDSMYKHHGFKQSLGEMDYEGRINYGTCPPSANHPHYTEEYTCRYSSLSSLEVPALQTVITTTTKMSLEAYKPAAKYGDNVYTVKDFVSSPLAENLSENICPQTSYQEDWAMDRSNGTGEHYVTPNKTMHGASVDTCQDSPNTEKGYATYEEQVFRFENTEY